MKIGYCRVSSIEQNEQAQVNQLKNYGCEKIFIDKESGTKDDRPEFLKLKETLRANDTLVVTELSRLGRKLIAVLEFVNLLKNLEVNLISIRESIDLASPSGTLVMQIFSSVAEFERNRLIERQRVGIDYAKQNGVRFGRPKTNDKKIQQAIKLYRTETMPVKEIVQLTGVSRATIYRKLQEEDKKGD